MDEPLSNLDAKLRVSMRAEIKHLQHELGITTVYVTHDQIEAMTMAHRVAVMRAGVIQQLAPPEQIYNDPANLFVAGFIGSPPMNLLRGALQDGDFVAPGIRIADVGAGSNPDVVLGVRPEDVHLDAPERADVTGPVYTFELTGEAILVTADVQAVPALQPAATGTCGLPSAEHVGMRISREHLFLFDAKTEARIRR